MLSKHVVSGLALGTAMLVSAAVPMVAQARDRVYIGGGYPVVVYPGNSYYGHYHHHHYYPSYYSGDYYYGGGYGYSYPAYGNHLTIIYRIY
ncbi:MAG TPA: hypothetical protein VHE58_05735 [Burkholderiales bacterium]|nr:hypothetical protein [Burkholderiales bacterium]